MRSGVIRADADDDAVDRRRLQQHRQRRVSAEHGKALHADARLPRIVVDESDHAHVAAIACEHLAERQCAAVAGAVDDDARPDCRCRCMNSPTSRNDARDSVTAISSSTRVDREHRARVRRRTGRRRE